MNNLIELDGLEKRFDQFQLGPIDLTLTAGCVTGLIGANGAGKTTTIKCLLGLLRADGGTIKLFDKVMPSEIPPAIKERIGVVFDSCAFAPDSSVTDVESLGKAAYHQWNNEVFRDYLETFAIDTTKKIKELSRGTGMKLSLAFALAHEPELLILDEATAGLDPIAREEVIDILRNFMLDESRGILFSTHITSDLEKIADELVCIDRGNLIFTLPKDDVFDRYGIIRCSHKNAQTLLEAEPDKTGIIRWIDRARSVELLIQNRQEFGKRFPSIALDRPSIDEFMTLQISGNCPLDRVP